MKKRILALLLSCSLAACFLTGCGNNEPTRSAPGSASSAVSSVSAVKEALVDMLKDLPEGSPLPEGLDLPQEPEIDWTYENYMPVNNPTVDDDFFVLCYAPEGGEYVVTHCYDGDTLVQKSVLRRSDSVMYSETYDKELSEERQQTPLVYTGFQNEIYNIDRHLPRSASTERLEIDHENKTLRVYTVDPAASSAPQE